MGREALLDIARYHADVESSLRLYFNEGSPAFADRFFGLSPDEVTAELSARLEETDLRSAFFALASVESAFRTDYEYRCRKKMKDALSRAFREINRSKKARVNLEEDIFEAWVENSTGARQMIGHLRGAFRFRHWIAHGRYWVPRLGRNYDFDFVYSLADDVLSTFPLFDPD